MYIPKLMLLIFNFILLVIGLIALSRGLTDYIPTKLKPLESTLVVSYFPKVMLFGGCGVLLIAFLGFWGAEIENRIALITYKILLCIVIGVELILVGYFLFHGESINDQLNIQLNYWMEEHDKSGHHVHLEQVKNYLQCCPFLNKTKCGGFTESCLTAASDYFQYKTSLNLWFLRNTIGSEIACIVFADMVAKKILMLQNIMLGKLGAT